MEFLSFPWEILPFKWSSTIGSVKDGFLIVIYYPWQAATLPPNQPPFTIIQPNLQGKRRLEMPAFWSAVPKGNSSKQTSINWNTDIYRVLWTEDSTAPTVIQETNTELCALQSLGSSAAWSIRGHFICPPIWDHQHTHNPPDDQKTCFLCSKDPPCYPPPNKEMKKKIKLLSLNM